METEISKALAAVRANPPHVGSPLPWHNDNKLGALYCHSGFEVCGGRRVCKEDRAHIAAAVNSAPVWAAEVERLQGLLANAEASAHDWMTRSVELGYPTAEDVYKARLAAARVAVAEWPVPIHTDRCAGWNDQDGDFAGCNCDCAAVDAARTEARRAVGLEEGK